jgi:hypothetical protein
MFFCRLAGESGFSTRETAVQFVAMANLGLASARRRFALSVSANRIFAVF